jgi:hypothetical protein
MIRSRGINLQLFTEGTDEQNQQQTQESNQQQSSQNSNQETNQGDNSQSNQQQSEQQSGQEQGGEDNSSQQQNQQQSLEKYENFTLPEGAVYDQALHDQFSTVALKHGLTQEAAQEFVSMYAGIRQNEQAALITEHEQRVQAWTDQAKADPVIAKNFDINLSTAKEMFTRFGGNEMVELLDSTGLGSHPAFVRMGMAVKAKVGEDDFPDGKGGGKDLTTSQLFFPNSK